MEENIGTSRLEAILYNLWLDFEEVFRANGSTLNRRLPRLALAAVYSTSCLSVSLDKSIFLVNSSVNKKT